MGTDELDPSYALGYAIGQLMFAVAAVALLVFGIVAIVRHNSRSGKSAQSGAPAPAAWYPDPEVPGHVRYWDGTQWTEYRQPRPPN